ncbi:MAG TPA: 30S ribosomal protein S6 [Candidatus Limnocylindria bacterium]|nr:30S ribosomal protein S6 [Candidatus Limnocylindria bacterium]
MRRYELMLLLRPDLDDEKLQAAVEKVTRAIVNGGGALTKVSPWGKRRLAYDIQHFREASYFLIHFDIEPSAIREIERGMLISEEILRHLVTVLEERPGEQPAEALTPEAAEEAAEAEDSTAVARADEPSPEDVEDRGATADGEQAERDEPVAESADAEPEPATSEA